MTTKFSGPWEYDQSGSPSRPLPPLVNDPNWCTMNGVLQVAHPHDWENWVANFRYAGIKVCANCGGRKS